MRVVLHVVGALNPGYGIVHVMAGGGKQTQDPVAPLV